MVESRETLPRKVCEMAHSLAGGTSCCDLSSDTANDGLDAVCEKTDSQPPAACHTAALSLVIPAYNEAKRLPRFLDAVRPYMQRVFGESYEVIVVDDGSSDATFEIVATLSHSWPQLRVIRHAVNRGKGGAVRTGVQASVGDMVLFADADGACSVSEEATLREAILQGADIAVGSRRVGSPSQVSRRWHRRFMGWCFACATRMTTGLALQDTQCGFKMFRRSVALELFASCPRDDYLFDVFVLMCAKARGHRVKEIGVMWTEVAGSQLHILRDSWEMVRGLITMRAHVRKHLRDMRER